MSSQTMEVRNDPKPQQQAKPAQRSIVQDRIEEIRAKRQARGELTNDLRQRLTVAEQSKDNLWEYRWVNDTQMRIADLQSQDWEFAPVETTQGDSRDSGIGTRVERIVNDRTVPTAEKAFLMRKPKEFAAEDRKRRRRSRANAEQDMQRGVVQASDGTQVSIENGYTVRGAHRIENNSFRG